MICARKKPHRGLRHDDGESKQRFNFGSHSLLFPQCVLMWLTAFLREADSKMFLDSAIRRSMILRSAQGAAVLQKPDSLARLDFPVVGPTRR